VRWWEDIRPGDVVELGPVDVREDEVVAFASAYDPQPFHLDPRAAAEGPFGGLIASCRHTVVSRCEVLNQRDEAVLQLNARGHFARRPA